MRGTAAKPQPRKPQVGITPACAGNRIQPPQQVQHLGDHPRVCGEQPLTTIASSHEIGSPPRVRGTAALPVLELGQHRITPACAGNSSFSFSLAAFDWDHPRVCGEQPFHAPSPTQTAGSPPRVRGTDRCFFSYAYSRGITPACAGNSVKGLPALGGLQDHPRVCGEQSFFNILHNNRIGSPPRVRGTGPTLPPLLETKGITPACAGNSCLWR